jgi:hypothetical protein
MVVVGLEGFVDPANNATRPQGGGFIVPAATVTLGASVGAPTIITPFNLTFSEVPQLAPPGLLAMGDNAIKLASTGEWLMLSYGFAPSAHSYPAGCIVYGPPGDLCRYTLFVMSAAPVPPNSTHGIPTEWSYRSNVTDPTGFGAEGTVLAHFSTRKVHSGTTIGSRNVAGDEARSSSMPLSSVPLAYQCYG